MKKFLNPSDLFHSNAKIAINAAIPNTIHVIGHARNALFNAHCAAVCIPVAVADAPHMIASFAYIAIFFNDCNLSFNFNLLSKL